MAKTPWEMAAVGREFSHQTALFAWAAMARLAGYGVANNPEAYKTALYAQRMSKGGVEILHPDPKFQPISELRWLHAIKNQGHGDAIRGSRSAAEGVRAGVFDVFLPVPTFYSGEQGIQSCGLYLELKKPNEGKPSEKQLEFQADMRANGYAAEIVYGWEAARDCLLQYLGKIS